MKITRLIRKIMIKTDKLRLKINSSKAEISELDTDCIYQLSKCYERLYKSLEPPTMED